MFQSILLMGGLGIAIGMVLVFASKVFYVYEDPTVVAIDDALPGANCGGCGYPGCSANAEAISQGLSGVNSCVAAGDEVAMAIAQIMGVSVSDKEPEFAKSGCHYGRDDADMEYQYLGVNDCRAAALMFGGMKVCTIGCLGLGTCVKACQFDALSIGSDGLPKVDQEKCTGCGACERVCPKHIIRLTSVTRRIIREYTEQDCTTPCQRACPTGIDIKEYIRLIREGDYHGSVQVIKERNPFPTVISRICPAICETQCRRLLQDEPVAINGLKRFVCDYEMNQNKRVMPYKAPATGKKVAIIGGGVQGLSTAFFSARLGHDPVIFEGTACLGGILRQAISRERLSMDVLDWDIEGIREMGVDIQTQTRAGIDFTIDDLLTQGFDSVFTATGGWDSRMARKEMDKAIPVFPGACLLIDLLRSQTNDQIRIEPGKKAVIVGGGTRVLDGVTILKENGYNTICVVLRRSQTDSPLEPAAVEDLSEAGATLFYQTGITRVIGRAEKLTAIECIDLDTGEKKVMDADTLIIGSGRFPELVFTRVEPEEPGDSNDGVQENEAVAWQGVELQKKPDSNRELGLLSNQDVTSEYASAVAAINGARRAAAAIHNLMYGIDFQDPARFITEQSRIQDVSVLNHVVPSSRHIMDTPSVKKRLSDDFSTGFSIEAAHDEADRCLRCGLVCYEKSMTAGKQIN